MNAELGPAEDMVERAANLNYWKHYVHLLSVPVANERRAMSAGKLSTVSFALPLMLSRSLFAILLVRGRNSMSTRRI